MTAAPRNALPARPLAPGDPAYDALRRRHDRRFSEEPAAIVPCRALDDVRAGLGHARRIGAPVRPRGAGHGPPVADGAVVLDLRTLDRIEIDPERCTARVGPAVTWGALDAAAQEHGLAACGSRFPATGVIGSVICAGSGWLERATGLAGDALVSARVLLADGRLVEATRTANADLLASLRGTGGAPGCVWEATIALRPLGPGLAGGVLTFPATEGFEVLRAYRDLLATAPDVLCGGAILAGPGALAGVPDSGDAVLAIVVAWAGDPASAAPWLARLRAIGHAGGGTLGTFRYRDLQELLAPWDVPGRRRLSTGGDPGVLDDRAVRRFVADGLACARRGSLVLLQPLGGAYARYAEDLLPRARDARWGVQVHAAWESPDDEAVTRIGALAATLTPLPGLFPSRWGGRDDAAFRRLRRIRERWDPTATFAWNDAAPSD